MSGNEITAAEIREFRARNLKMRERDIARILGISEAQLVAADCGTSATRINPDPNLLLFHAGSFGEVMALSRNESAVHEKIGVYENVQIGEATSLTLGSNIDLRIFNKVWAHAFAVVKKDGENVRRSLQYFDRSGEAIHKVHLKPQSNFGAFDDFVSLANHADQGTGFDRQETRRTAKGRIDGFDVENLRDRWSKLTDTHEFFGMLRELDIDRRAAIRSVGHDYARKLEQDSMEEFFTRSVESGIDLMCFVANRGIVQIHTGPVRKVEKLGPWINVMDPTFHLHLRADHIADLWVVRKPTRDGHVTSLEAYDQEGDLIIQFFGKRKEGNAEMSEWRSLLESLPANEAIAA